MRPVTKRLRCRTVLFVWLARTRDRGDRAAKQPRQDRHSGRLAQDPDRVLRYARPVVQSAVRHPARIPRPAEQHLQHVALLLSKKAGGAYGAFGYCESPEVDKLLADGVKTPFADQSAISLQAQKKSWRRHRWDGWWNPTTPPPSGATSRASIGTSPREPGSTKSASNNPAQPRTRAYRPRLITPVSSDSSHECAQIRV